MAPAAMTAAGREAAKRGRTPAAGRLPGGQPHPLMMSASSSPEFTRTADHRRRVARPNAPKHPRRVSGPAHGRDGGMVLPRPNGPGAAPSPRRPARPGSGSTAPQSPARKSAAPRQAPAAPRQAPAAPRQAASRQAPVTSRKAPSRTTASPLTRAPRPTASRAAPVARGTVAFAGAAAVIAPGIEWAPRVDHRRRPRTAAVTEALPLRAVRFVWTLPDHPLLDRIVRGRFWIAVLGVMLVGIVAMQVEMLKLGAGIGRTSAQTITLQSRNQTLESSVAALSDSRRIERLAAQSGMILPQPTGIGFVRSGDHLRQALRNIHPPSTTTFVAASHANGAITTRQDASTDSAAPATSYTP